MNAKGFEQVAGKNFDLISTAASLMKNITLRIVLVLILLVDWMAKICHVKGMFFKGKIENGKDLFMEVPQGMEHHIGV